MCHRAGLDAVENKKMLRCRESKPGRPARRYTESLLAMEAPQFSLQMLKFLLIRKPAASCLEQFMKLGF
jgi:hypothetical protein